MVAIIDDCFFATTARVPYPKPNLYSDTTSSTTSSFSTDTILVSLDSSSNPAVRSLLAKQSANLIDVGTHMLSALRELAPSQLAARVGDIHENLSYEMQECEDIASMLVRGKLNKMMKQNGSCCLHDDSTSTVLSQSILDDIQSFEHSIRSKLQQTHISYRGSYMRTLHTAPQPAHVDYDYPTLAEHGTRLFLAFFPLTEEGAYLQLWHEDPALLRCISDDEDADDDNDIGAAEEDDYPVHDSSSISSSISSTRRIKSRSDVSTTIVEGTMVYIPYGKMLIVPSDTIHGGDSSVASMAI